MANNYEFIIAGLPMMALDFESREFRMDELAGSIRQMVSQKDNRLIDWLFFGMEAKNMNPHFYRAARKCKDSFIKGYYAFDWEIRNIIAAYNAREYGHNILTNLMGRSELTDVLVSSKAENFDLDSVSAYSAVLHKIMQLKNPLEREQQIDKLRWDTAVQLTTFHYFDIDVILAFLLKASIVSRWAKLDKETGSRLFKELVQEVKGTYKA